VRVDGNVDIGLGHLIRCKSLSGMLDQVFNICFVSAGMPAAVAQDLQDIGYEVRIIDREDEFTSMVKSGDIVVLDGYDFKLSLQEMIRGRGGKLVVIDDIPNGIYTADAIINHSPNVKSTDYQVVNGDCVFALGFDYALLRQAFIEQACKIRQYKLIDSLLICFGGADRLNLTSRAVIESAKFEAFKKIHVVTGPAYEYTESLRAYMAGDKRFYHYMDVTDEQMRDLMLETELAIVPTSGLLLEAIACKARIIYGMYSENQKLFYNLLTDTMHGIDAARFSSNDLRRALERSFTHFFSGDRLSIDGQSPRRILQLFRSLLITLRLAVWEDAEILFNWANDPEVRNNAINPEPITLQEHLEWFERKLSAVSTRIYIMEYAGVPVGQVRYDREGEGWLIDYSVTVEHRGKGFGTKLIQQSLVGFKKEKIIAKVLYSNAASVRVFESTGFLATSNENIEGSEYGIFSLQND
jgi:UDP-2,4-diacetamido-2,4,6-trideoxy-beta-L-altropyranose hydrolase